MKIHKCDICKAERELGETIEIDVGVGFKLKNIVSSSLDLCKVCYEELLDFIQLKKQSYEESADSKLKRENNSIVM